MIRLKVRGKPFIFTDGKFSMPDVVPELTKSALQLRDRVLISSEKVAKKMLLFLRGGADYRRLLGSPEIEETRDLLVLPRLPDGNYAGVPRRRRPAIRVRNVDLPNLRADWLRQNLGPVLTDGSAESEILQNTPAADQERTVDVILYVQW